ncbi:MAG: hypothetical protein K1Y02_24390, partial [Candidatus Hydrogenedentes bacterium]|nr:hypothetical protein [Candidatus Hydrogenedentota bacterium]
QEVASTHTILQGLPSDEITGIAVANGDIPYVGTPSGLFTFPASGSGWIPVSEDTKGSVTVLGEASSGVIAVVDGAIVIIDKAGTHKLGQAPTGTIHALAANGSSAFAGTDSGLYVIADGKAAPVDSLNKQLGGKPDVFALAIGPDGMSAGTASGLFESRDGKEWTALYPADDKGRSWAPRNVRGVAYDSKGRLWFASPQGAGCRDGDTWTLYTGAEGLPYNDFTCMAAGEDGVVWFGTTKGAIRYDGTDWEYRQGRRWLPDDHVRAVAVNANGDAGFATSKGLGVIERKPMTLAEKAAFYESEIDKYNRRTEYGYVLEARLERPGDKSKWFNHDSDNDGLWTSMYGAGECFGYAATKDPKIKERAKKAFEALRFLSVAPVDGEVKQQPGYVARTVVETTEEDPNIHYTLEKQQRDRDKGDKLWKVYTPRWPLTKDKKYWYKTDTSSDELDGHYFFYPLYYDLVADTEEEKERVREVVRNLTDHLLRNDFCLVDFDGTPTRWSVYSPKELNHNHMWYSERGLKSLSILSYLTVAEHMTGDSKYSDAIKMLRELHAFDTNAMVTKIQRGFGSGNQSDDEMAFMCYYNLVKYTKDPELKMEMAYSFYKYWILEYPEMNPFFNFAFAAVTPGPGYVNPWGTFDLSPWKDWLVDSVDTLKRFPLDRLDWSHDNSERIDIIMLPRQQALEPYEPDHRVDRGYRVNGKVLPVDERHFNHWNTDPWQLKYGGNGSGLADGAVFLLPYYMGLYHGFIK